MNVPNLKPTDATANGLQSYGFSVWITDICIYVISSTRCDQTRSCRLKYDPVVSEGTSFPPLSEDGQLGL